MAKSVETSWIVLTADGRHVTVGRAVAPSEADLAQYGAKLVDAALSGWLCQMAGVYHGKRKVSLELVKPLGTPTSTLPCDAEAAFHSIRNALHAGA